MLIGEVAERTGVDARTIRFYEAEGVLPEPGRTEAGYRTYTDEDAARVRFVRRARDLDLGLDEIREVLALRDRGEAPCGYVREVAAVRLEELDDRIRELEAAREELAALLGRSPGEGDGRFCPLIEGHNVDEGAQRTEAGVRA